MRTVASAINTHLSGDASRMALCWKVTRTDAVVLLGTEHDRDITIAAGAQAGTYKANAGITGSNLVSRDNLSADNLEMVGAFPEDVAIVDIRAADIEAGLLDNAAVTTFLVNWSAPNDGQVIMRHGNIGAITRTAEGRYQAEVRGLAQRLSQTIVRTFQASCDADLGDTRCGITLASYTRTGTVSAVTSRRRFNGSISGAATAAGWFNYGLLTFTSGANNGYAREVRRDAVSGTPGQWEVWEPFPKDVAVNDTYSVTPGCDKTAATCKAKFSNLVNFRGHGLFTPGLNDVMTIGEGR